MYPNWGSFLIDLTVGGGPPAALFGEYYIGIKVSTLNFSKKLNIGRLPQPPNDCFALRYL